MPNLINLPWRFNNLPVSFHVFKIYLFLFLAISFISAVLQSLLKTSTNFCPKRLTLVPKLVPKNKNSAEIIPKLPNRINWFCGKWFRLEHDFDNHVRGGGQLCKFILRERTWSCGGLLFSRWCILWSLSVSLTGVTVRL